MSGLSAERAARNESVVRDANERIDARLAALTVDEVNAAIRRHIDPAKLSVYLAGDFAKATPAK